MNNKQEGKFIVIYGTNNIGKSTQTNKVADYFRDAGRDVLQIKYPLYELAPTGSLINDYLREGNPFGFSAREAQTLYAMNRTHFDAELREKHGQGQVIVSEDYVGTSLAWGQVTGVSKEYLLQINSHLLEPDVVILLDGEQFSGREDGHQFEGNDDRMAKSRQIHLELAKEFNWRVVNANQSIDEVFSDIMNEIKE